MPIYEYRCEKCGHRFERWQKMSDPDPEQCPECKAGEVNRLISAVGFRLKGSGWYETDFKKDNRRNIAGDGASTEKKEKPGSGDNKGASESKPTPKKSDSSASSANKTGDSAA